MDPLAIVIVVVAVLALCVFGVFIWFLLRWNAAQADAATARSELESRLALASAASAQQASELDRVRAEAAGALEEAKRESRRADEKEIEAAQLHERLKALAESERAHRADLEERLRQAHTALRDGFKSSAADALKASTEQLVKMADENFKKANSSASESLTKLISPITDTLKRADTKLADIEKARTESYAALREHLGTLHEHNLKLTDETRKLTAALRRPEVRGRYGEIQLERVAELAGMRDYCDFSTQSSAYDAEGNLQRPDMIVSLPNERQVVVDAKTNIDAYLDAIETDDPDEQERHLDRFARHVLDQAKALSKKTYWAQYDGSPDFTVMFIPGDQFIDAALKREPKILDLAAQQNVLLASPSTLIGLLRAVHVGWREKNLSDQAKELFELGRELHERVSVALEHTGKLGTHLKRSVETYNKLVGSVDTRLLPTIRRFEDAGAKSAKELDQPEMVDVQVKPIAGQMLLEQGD